MSGAHLLAIAFTPAADTIALPDAEEVARYLAQAPVLAVATGFTPDEVDPSQGDVVPIGVATDGSYRWPLALHYYVAKYGCPFDDRLLSAIRSRSYLCPQLPPHDLHELRSNLYTPGAADHDEVGKDPDDPFA